DMSLTETVRAGRYVSDRLKRIPGMVSVIQQAGRAELSEDTWGPNVSELWVVLDDAKIDQALAEMRDCLKTFPGYEFQIQDTLRERIDEVLTGVTTDIVIRVFGPDLAELRTQATRIAAAIRNVDGLQDLRVEQQVDIPQIEVLLQPREASR